MQKIYKQLLPIFMIMCFIGAQSPACAKGFNFFKKKNKEVEETVIEEEVLEEDGLLEEETKMPDEIPAVDEVSSSTSYDDENLVYIKTLEIMGNNIIETSFIKDMITSREGHIYDRNTISKDLNVLYSTGYFTKNIRAVPIKSDDGTIRLRIIVEENPPIKGFTFTGNDSIPTSDLMELVEPLEGKPQNIIEINEAVQRMQELYSSRGYILANVNKVEDDPDGIVNFTINEGIIGDIKVVGNYKTKDFIVKRNILSSPGQVYNDNVMRADIMRLMGTQAFSDVQRDAVLNEDTGLYDITINLEEQRTGRVSVGVGVDSSQGFFGSVGFGQNNFRGLGQKLSLNFQVGSGILMDDNTVLRRANWQADVSFVEPHFKRENQSLGFHAFLRSFGSYQVPLAIERRYGADMTLARVFEKYPRLTGSVSLGVEDVDLSEGDEGKIRALFTSHGLSMAQRDKQLDGGFYIKAIPAIAYDTRDNAMDPRHGVVAKISLEEALALSGDSYNKVSGAIKKYIPVGKRSSVVLTGRVGTKLFGDIPEFAMYSLGGPYSIRGFNVSEVGSGEGYMMGTAEYRMPIPFMDRLTTNKFINNIKIAAFVDGGKIFKESLSDKLYDRPGYAISAGVGLRIFIPGLGPINLDYGYPLTNTHGSRKNGFFTFGMGDML